MARKKVVYGKKLIYRWSASVFFTILFSLGTLAVMALSCFLPLFVAPIEGVEGVNALDFIYLYIHLFTGEANTKLDAYRTFVVNNTFDGFKVADPIINVLFYEMGIIVAVLAILSLILAIATLALLFKGHLKHWATPYCMTKRIFIWSLLSFHGIFVGLNVYSMIAKHYSYDTLFSYIFLGSLLALTIILHVIFAKCFKGHVYIKNTATLNKYIDEYEKANVVTDTTTLHKDDVVIIAETPRTTSSFTTNLSNNDDDVVIEAIEPNNESSDNRKYLPRGLKSIGGHAFSQNTALEVADIPLGIEVLGAGAFANCVNLREVHIPESVKKIEYNCFFNCIRLKRITYGGSREMWKKVKRGSNWLVSAGTRFVVCIDGALTVNPEK